MYRLCTPPTLPQQPLPPRWRPVSKTSLDESSVPSLHLTYPLTPRTTPTLPYQLQLSTSTPTPPPGTEREHSDQLELLFLSSEVNTKSTIGVVEVFNRG
eukprot:760044-Hanusia_phi.AAC.8